MSDIAPILSCSRFVGLSPEGVKNAWGSSKQSDYAKILKHQVLLTIHKKKQELYTSPQPEQIKQQIQGMEILTKIIDQDLPELI